MLNECWRSVSDRHSCCGLVLIGSILCEAKGVTWTSGWSDQDSNTAILLLPYQRTHKSAPKRWATVEDSKWLKGSGIKEWLNKSLTTLLTTMKPLRMWGRMLRTDRKNSLVYGRKELILEQFVQYDPTYMEMVCLMCHSVCTQMRVTVSDKLYFKNCTQEPSKKVERPGGAVWREIFVFPW